MCIQLIHNPHMCLCISMHITHCLHAYTHSTYTTCTHTNLSVTHTHHIECTLVSTCVCTTPMHTNAQCGYHMCIHMHKYHTITHMHTHAYTQRTHVCMFTLQACMLTYRSHTYTDYMHANVQRHTHICTAAHRPHTHTYPCLFDGETNFSPLSPASTLQYVFSAAQSMVNSANAFSALGILLAWESC